METASADGFLIEPRHTELSRARSYIAGACAHAGIEDEPAARLILAANEVCANVIAHGGGASPISLSLVVEEARLSLIVRDRAEHFDPRSIRAADVSLGVERPIGGLGWHLVRDAVDDIGYRRTGGRNAVTLTIDVSSTRQGSR